MQSPLHSEPPQHTEPTMQDDGQLDSHVPFAQVMSPEPQGSGPHTPPGAHGQLGIPSGHVFTISHQVPLRGRRDDVLVALPADAERDLSEELDAICRGVA